MSRFALYLLASALAAFDRKILQRWEIVTRIILSALVITTIGWMYTLGLIIMIGLVGMHWFSDRPKPTYESG